MQIILLSGGSGKRLWPLSNDSRSKQFIKCLTAPDGSKESMVQRVFRQLEESGICGNVTVATSASQRDAVLSQLGDKVSIVTEPQRRDTFSAIALSCAYLEKVKACPSDEVVVVMPCDPYTETGYFKTISKMAGSVRENVAELLLMGISPTYPSSKYGYIVPFPGAGAGSYRVRRFTEKPSVPMAESLISEGAFWNGGVFAFRLGYMSGIIRRYVDSETFGGVRSRYAEFPKISFDYEVAEKASSVAVVPFTGTWKDLGTWNTLTEELPEQPIGNVILDNSANTHVINELEIPVMCIGTNNLVIAASCDGILVSDKAQSENIKHYADKLQRRPMYEERRWGEYKVVDSVEYGDGHKALTKQLTIKAGKSISYQIHHHREEVWTFIDGEGLLLIDGEVRKVGQGDVVHIRKEMKHAIKAVKDLCFIEVQMGTELTEDDIERFEWEWLV